MRRAVLLLPALLLACSAPANDAADDSSALDGTPTATLHFKSDWTIEQTGRIGVGTKVMVDYDTARTPCTGTMNGHPAFAVTAHVRVGGGAESTFVAAGHAPSGTLDPTFTVGPAVVRESGAPSTDLEMWFESTSIWGCHEWDSSMGNNFHFEMKIPSSAPDWMGNGRVVLSRQTCDGHACEGDGKPLGTGFLYDSWVVQRAAIRELSFEVYEPGVTDRDDPDMWKKLDARLYTRIGDQGPFTSSYVDLDGRAGNNARYVVDLSKLEPFPVSTQTSGCPSFPVERRSDGTLRADVQFYLRVNGVELRPADGTVFHGTYEGYAQTYPSCPAL